MRLRRLTEAQAWETLARFFSQPWVEESQGLSRQGLCHQTNRLVHHGLIGFRISVKMSAVIHRELDRLGRFRRAYGAYFYRLDREGARKRSEFCWRQVRRLKRQRRK